MVRRIALTNSSVDDVEVGVDCVTDQPVELYLKTDDVKLLESTILSLFDAESVERIKTALKKARR